MPTSEEECAGLGLAEHGCLGNAATEQLRSALQPAGSCLELESRSKGGDMLPASCALLPPSAGVWACPVDQSGPPNGLMSKPHSSSRSSSGSGCVLKAVSGSSGASSGRAGQLEACCSAQGGQASRVHWLGRACCRAPAVCW